MLAFKTEVQAEFEKILSAKIENNLSDAALGKLIHAVVSDEDVKNYAVEVSEVNDSLKAELAEEIKNGLCYICTACTVPCTGIGSTVIIQAKLKACTLKESVDVPAV